MPTIQSKQPVYVASGTDTLEKYNHSTSTTDLSKYEEDDHLIEVFKSDALTYKDVEELVVGLNPQRAPDILISYRILSTLTKYLEETNSWTFCMLNNYDFQMNVRQFDLDVAIVIGRRAEHILSEIHSWNIPKLKKMVMGFTTYYSDEATILTIIIFRIVSKYSDLEFTLQLALSRSTLIKINYEMTGLFSKFPGGSDAAGSDSNPELSSRNDELVSAYRKFVSQLLNEIENSPFESVQQELFQVVRDLKSMFSKFSDSRVSKSLEDKFDEDDAFYGEARLPPLPENDDLSLKYMKPSLNRSSSGVQHKRSFSNSTMFSTNTAATNKTTISEELPNLLNAFDIVKKKDHYQSPPETPTNLNASPTSPTSPTTSSVSTTQRHWSASSTRKSASPPSVSGSATSALVHKPQAPTAHEVPEGPMQVKMVNNRMMIFVDGKYMDMQEWAGTVNSTQPHNPPPLPLPQIHAPVPAATTNPIVQAPSFSISNLFQPWSRASPKALTSSGEPEKPNTVSVTNEIAGPRKEMSTLEMLRNSKMMKQPSPAFAGPKVKPTGPTGMAGLINANNGGLTGNNSGWLLSNKAKEAESQFERNYDSAMRF